MSLSISVNKLEIVCDIRELNDYLGSHLPLTIGNKIPISLKDISNLFYNHPNEDKKYTTACIILFSAEEIKKLKFDLDKIIKKHPRQKKICINII